MKSRRIFKETYVSDNKLNSKTPISPKEETYISKYSNYKSIKKYTKKDVDMIIKIQRWWKSILPKLNKYKKLDNSNSKRSVESLRVRHYSNSSFNNKKTNKYDNNSNNYKYLYNSLNSNASFQTNFNTYSNNTNSTSNTNNFINSRKNQNSKSYTNNINTNQHYHYNSNTSTQGSNINYIQTQTITRKSETRSNPQGGSLSTSPSVKSKYLVETKRVEIFRKPKSKYSVSSFSELSRNDIKGMIKNIWTEESFCSTVESLSIISDENKKNNLSENNSNNSIILEQYEEKITELKNLLIEKDYELNNLIKNLSQVEKENENENVLYKNININKNINSWNDVNIPSPINEIHIESIKNDSIQESISNLDGVLEIQEINALSIISNKTRYNNICQHLQSLTIFSQTNSGLKEKDEELLIQKIEEINITAIIPKIKNQNKIQELDGLEILCIDKNKNEKENIVQKMDKILINKSLEDNNIIQELDGIEILKPKKQPHIPQCVDELLISREYDMLLVKPVWNKLKIEGAGLNLLAIKKENALENQEIDEFIIARKNKPELIMQTQTNINYFKIENNKKIIKENIIEKINNIELIGEYNQKQKEEEKIIIKNNNINKQPLLILEKENIETLQIKKSYETKENWDKIIKPVKTTKLIIKNSNKKTPKKIIEKQEIETIERIYKDKNWTEEIKPIKTTKLKIKGTKIPHVWNELNIEEKDKLNILNNNIMKIKESFNIESFAFNLDEDSKRFDNLLYMNNNNFCLKGNEQKKKFILTPIQCERIMLKNIEKEEKIKIVEKIIEKKINWNESNIPTKNIYFNLIHIKENKTHIFKKQRSNNINLIGLELPKQQLIKNWKNILSAQKSGKFSLQGKANIIQTRNKLLIANGDKFFIQRESDDEIIYNDDYNSNKSRQKTEEKEKAKENINIEKNEKEIIPKYQREIRAQIARVKELSESDSSSQSDLDVLEGIKSKNEQNKELIRISSGYQTKKINSEVIYTAKNGLAINTGGALYQKQLKYDYNKKYNTNIDEEKTEINDNCENYNFMTKILGGRPEEKKMEISKKDEQNNQKKQIIITNSKIQTTLKNGINNNEIIINNSLRKSNKIPKCDNKYNNDEIKKGQVIFNPKIKTAKLQSHYSTNSACLTGRGNVIINSRRNNEKINEGYSMDNSYLTERKGNVEIKLKRTKVKKVELLRDNDSQQSF